MVRVGKVGMLVIFSERLNWVLFLYFMFGCKIIVIFVVFVGIL